MRRRANLKRIYEDYTERIGDQRQQVEHRRGNHRLITDRAKEIVRQFPMQLRQYQDHLDFIIAAYRSANEMARTTPSPEFFGRAFAIDQEMLEAPRWHGVRRPNYNEDWDGFRQADEAIRTAYQEAQAGYPTLEDRMER